MNDPIQRFRGQFPEIRKIVENLNWDEWERLEQFITDILTEQREELADKIINIIAKRMVESKTDKEVDFGQDVLKQLTEI